MNDVEDDATQLEGDRKTVEALIARGDPLTKARQVDHWIYFPTANARDAFVDEVEPMGFSVDTDDDGGEPNPYCAYASRMDHVDLVSIHRVVMMLFAAAKRTLASTTAGNVPSRLISVRRLFEEVRRF